LATNVPVLNDVAYDAVVALTALAISVAVFKLRIIVLVVYAASNPVPVVKFGVALACVVPFGYITLPLVDILNVQVPFEIVDVEFNPFAPSMPGNPRNP
jgi:hypothetical protein